MQTKIDAHAPLHTETNSEANPARWIIPLVALLLVALVAAVSKFGIVALGLTMVAATPVIFVILILITVGK